MSENEYGKYFLEMGKATEKPFIMGPVLKRFDHNKVPGSHFYFLHWVLPHDKLHMTIAHPPHIHKEAGLLIHSGINPEDPSDLGVEVELGMEPRMEKHINYQIHRCPGTLCGRGVRGFL